MRTTTGVLLSLLLATAVASCGNPGDQSSEVLRVAVLPDQNAETLRARHEPLLEYLAAEIDADYELTIPADYGELVRLFEDGEIDLAWFGGLTFLRARQAAQAVPLAMRDIDLEFTSLFLVHASSEAMMVEDLAGARLCFGSELSTSGHLMPRYFLEQRGIDAESFFGEVCHSGGHDATVTAVSERRADLGVANASIVRLGLRDGTFDGTVFRILEETPRYVDYVWAVHPSLAEGRRTALLTAFLGLRSTEEAHTGILNRHGASGFVPATAQDFTALEAIARRLGLLEDP